MWIDDDAIKKRECKKPKRQAQKMKYIPEKIVVIIIIIIFLAITG